MHWRTFERLLREYAWHQQAALSGCLAAVRWMTEARRR
jgi:hypothetical protein